MLLLLPLATAAMYVYSNDIARVVVSTPLKYINTFFIMLRAINTSIYSKKCVPHATLNGGKRKKKFLVQHKSAFSFEMKEKNKNSSKMNLPIFFL